MNLQIGRIKIDGTNHFGKFLLAEIMNIRSISSNLFLSPDGHRRGEFQVVLVPENDKDKFAAYVSNKINGAEEKYNFHTVKSKEVIISWEGTYVHAENN